jgi:hypothetical protein
MEENIVEHDDEIQTSTTDILKKLANNFDKYKKENDQYMTIIKKIFGDEEFKKEKSYDRLYKKYYPFKINVPGIIEIPDYTKQECLKLSKKTSDKIKITFKKPIKIIVNDIIYIIHNNKIYNENGYYINTINDNIIIDNNIVEIKNTINNTKIVQLTKYKKDTLYNDKDNFIYTKFGNFLFKIGEIIDNEPLFYDD